MELSPDFTFHDALLLLLRSQMGNCGFLWGFFFFGVFPRVVSSFFCQKIQTNPERVEEPQVCRTTNPSVVTQNTSWQAEERSHLSV